MSQNIDPHNVGDIVDQALAPAPGFGNQMIVVRTLVAALEEAATSYRLDRMQEYATGISFMLWDDMMALRKDGPIGSKS